MLFYGQIPHQLFIVVMAVSIAYREANANAPTPVTATIEEPSWT